jgi:hypothetical protein
MRFESFGGVNIRSTERAGQRKEVRNSPPGMILIGKRLYVEEDRPGD